MTEIDFYLLGEQESRFGFACKLINKIFSLGNSIFVCTESEKDSHEISSALWNFASSSFLANEIIVVPEKQENKIESRTPIRICHNICDQSAPLAGNDVLVNLSLSVPPHFSRFIRHVEIISGDEATKEKLRDNYRFYQQRGYPLKFHHLDKK